MLFPAFFAIAVALYVDVPMLPVVVLCALFQAGVAYWLTRSALSLNTGIGVAVVAMASFFVVPLLGQASGGTLSPRVLGFVGSTATALTWISAVLGLASVTLTGWLGRNGRATPHQAPPLSAAAVAARSTTRRRAARRSAAGTQQQGDSDGFCTSMAVGAVTGSAAVGYVAGGSISGAILGAELGSNDATQWSSSDSGSGGGFSD